METKDAKTLMFEAAILYYERNYTQQEIAKLMNLSRQTISKLLNYAVKENIVEIKIHNPQKNSEKIEKAICSKFNINRCIVANASSNNEHIRKAATIKAASEYIYSIIKVGNKKIALSWGRTIQELINTLPAINTKQNIVFPLFGATDSESLFFSSNELTRLFADQIGAQAKYAWFPYLTESIADCELLKKLSYYKNIQTFWDTADIAILGIGNTKILDIFGENFGYSKKHFDVVGDIATHFFNKNGELVELYKHTLCASTENIKKTHSIAIACGDDKVTAILGALRTKLIDTLITDEYTARSILETN